ncbi:MAG: hypothetical protein ACRDPH_10625 [Marmoricola sp.]
MATTTPHERPIGMRDRLNMPRSRGATSGGLLVLLGIWGGLCPFWGPMFGYAFTPDVSWHFTMGRLWLEILPAVATVLGGLSLMGSANKISGWSGAWLAAVGGAWFVVGQEISMLWNSGAPQAGHPTATSTLGVVAQQIGFFDGLGVVIVFLAALALGRMMVVGVRDVRPATTARAVPEQRAAGTEREAEAETGHRADT